MNAAVIGGTPVTCVLLIKTNKKKLIQPDSEDHRTFSIQTAWQHRGGNGDAAEDMMGGNEGDEGLEDWNVVVDLGAVPLGDALGDPHDVPALLLLQLDVGVENAEVELVEEGQLVQLHLSGGRRGHQGQLCTKGRRRASKRF